MIRSFGRRHWPALVLVLFSFFGILLFHLQRSPKELSFIPPPPVILTHAWMLGQGVQIEWLEGQAGTHPVSGYVIERSRRGSDFKRIGRVESISQAYLDADGQTGDTYRVVAEDTGRPPRRSKPSEHVTAALPKPGSKVVQAPASPSTLAASTTSHTGTPAEKATAAQEVLAQTFMSFDAALTAQNLTAARSLFPTLQLAERQILSQFPQLTAEQKASLAQTCTTHINVFETNLFRLSERDQLDGQLVLAGCNAIQGGI